MIEDFSLRRRSVLLSLAIHGAVVIFLVYRSFHSAARLTPQQQAINVALVSPELQPKPIKSSVSPAERAASSHPDPMSGLVITEKLTTPVQDKATIALPEPLKRNQHLAKTKTPMPRTAAQPVKRSQSAQLTRAPTITKSIMTKAKNPFKPLNDSEPLQPQTAPKVSQNNADAVLEGKPLRTRTVQPVYPERALALQQEGRVEVSFDINAAGHVENIKIIAAQPRNLFEHAVKMALSRWHYQSGRAASNQRVVIQFKLNDGASID